jgi:hypothetical protein
MLKSDNLLALDNRRVVRFLSRLKGDDCELGSALVIAVYFVTRHKSRRRIASIQLIRHNSKEVSVARLYFFCTLSFRNLFLCLLVLHHLDSFLGFIESRVLVFITVFQYFII